MSKKPDVEQAPQPEDGTQETPEQRRARWLKEAEESRRVTREREQWIEALDGELYTSRIQEIAAEIKQLGLHPDDIMEYIRLGKRPTVWPSKTNTEAATTRTKLKAKYFNPENPAETWSGNSNRPPKWAVKYMTSPEGVKPRTFDPAIWIENKPA